MSRFEVGKKVVCIKEGIWRNGLGNNVSGGPKYGEILTIDDTRLTSFGIGLNFKKHDHGTGKLWWAIRNFEPIDEDLLDEAIIELLTEPAEEII